MCARTDTPEQGLTGRRVETAGSAHESARQGGFPRGALAGRAALQRTAGRGAEGVSGEGKGVVWSLDWGVCFLEPPRVDLALERPTSP